MIDTKVKTLTTLVQVGSYTQTAKLLSLTQPAVSHQIKQLEQIYNIKIFYDDKKPLTLTPEGEVLVKYANRLLAIDGRIAKAIEDVKKSVNSFTVGITATVGEYMFSQLIVSYCNEHPDVHINIITDNIKNIYSKLLNYELDWAIVEGQIKNDNFTSVLLDTDYLCLVVSPQNPLASKSNVTLRELKKEKFILRSPDTGTRSLFENTLIGNSESIENFNVIIEIDNISTIKELVAANLGVTVMAHSACREEEATGQLVIVPVENFNPVREINIIYNKTFEHTDIIDKIRRSYILGSK